MEIFKKESFQSFLLALGLLLLAITAQRCSLSFMLTSSNKVLKPLIVADSLQNANLKSLLADSIPKLKTLNIQYQTAQEIKTYYKDLAVSYYVNYYAFSICSILFTTLLTIAIFLVVNKGWQTSQLILKTFLLTTVVLSSIYYFLPNVLNNKENLQKNSDKVKAFQKIQSDILIFSNKYNQADKEKLDSALTSNYEQIILNFDFITTIDNSKLNSNPQDLLKSIKP
ncbi:MAG: hypothetical protein IPN13_07890 [Bacteroidetes bacterium]|nr:hypothetical protein [Bacteroidota bacterium]MBK8873834.1 hypothetical protein [Bacteroidota bacterium]